ncbi:DNA methylase [Geobacillus sp. GHH01]|uniref:restriction endonuclease subunit S n=1 Tax=Geobacillus TaxID=129337 RepID=UPI0002AF3D58|nr:MULTISPECIES: restriction endonuclease subunit S [Geobacillus]AGE20934.1 DNA methylase [Geobacillus sp. GHH01]
MFSKYQDKKSLRSLQKNPNWKLLKFSDVLRDETKNAKKIKKEEYLAQGSYPIIDQGKDYIAGFTNDGDGIYDKSPLIIFGDHTRILKYIDFPIFIGADGAKLLKNVFSEEEVLTKYIYYYLRTVNIPDTGYNRHFKFLKEVVIPIPSIDLQKRIVSVLDKAQELIDKRKAQIEALDQLTQSVFLEMFGDPVSNPKGWDVKKLKDIAEIEDGDRGENYPKQHELVSEGILFLSTSNFVNNKLDLSKVTYITKEKFSQLRKGKLRRGDLIVTLRGSIGNIVIFDEEGYDTGFINAQMAILRLKNVNRIFFQQLYTSNSFQLVLKKTQTGSSQPQLPLKNLKELEIIIPPLELQELFAATIQQINLKKELLLKSQAEIQNMFNSLMQRAFKGELFND